MSFNQSMLDNAIRESDELWEETLTYSQELDVKAGFAEGEMSPLKRVISKGRSFGDMMGSFLQDRLPNFVANSPDMKLSEITRMSALRLESRQPSISIAVFQGSRFVSLDTSYLAPK